MKYIHRDLESKIQSLTTEYSCILITGPRQVGKTTTLLSIMEPTRTCVTLEDVEERMLAKRNPAMFFRRHALPIFIDEVQYAPELFPYIRTALDNGVVPGSFWLTGSHTFYTTKLAQESLAGRVAVLHMSSLSQHEIYGTGRSSPFSVDLSAIKMRKQTHATANVAEIYERIWNGSMPGLISGKYTDRDAFYSSYLQTYIDRDVAPQINQTEKLLFRDFIRAAACRAGQLLRIHDIASDAGVSDDTSRHWLQVLEKTGIIFCLHSYPEHLLKRTSKLPKMYFFDTGLVAYLTRYSSSRILTTGAMRSAILENYVVSEIRKTYMNNGNEISLWYYRHRKHNEIDLIMENNGVLHPIGIRRSVNPDNRLIRALQSFDGEGSTVCGTGAILCLRPDLSAIDAAHLIVPIWMI